MHKYAFIFILLVISAFFPGGLSRAQGTNPTAFLLTIDGAISPAYTEYLTRGIRTAEEQGAELIILQLDTPGGSIDVMNNMIKAIRSSSVPVVVYVSPEGAMAASAGTLITLAGHAAAMAPGTSIGAASPVGGEGEDLGKTLEAKQKNILKATVRSLTERRGDQALHLAEEMIDSAEAVSASEALEAGLIDFISQDIDQLLQQLNGFNTETTTGITTIITEDIAVHEISPSFIEQLLSILTNPNIVFILLTVGVQAILIEISHPGGWVAGFIGAVCLLLAVYGMGVLPVNWFGIIFIILAFVLFILDIKAPTHGALTAAGVVSLIVGSLVLFNSPSVPNFQRVSVPLVIGLSLATGAIFFVILGFALRTQRVPIRTGKASVIGQIGTVRRDLDPIGLVQLGGEQWTAEPVHYGETISRGTTVEVVQVDGLHIKVRQVKKANSRNS